MHAMSQVSICCDRTFAVGLCQVAMSLADSYHGGRGRGSGRSRGRGRGGRGRGRGARQSSGNSEKFTAHKVSFTK